MAPIQETFRNAESFDEAIVDGLGHITRAFGTRPVTPEDGRACLAALQERVVAANRFGYYRWGRVEVTMGEDPHLVSELGLAYVQGLQSSSIVATLKHFAGYSTSRSGRNHAPATLGPRELADVILPPFEKAVVHDPVGSVMNAYNETDAIPCGADEALLTRLPRDEWGFGGTVVSDYWSNPSRSWPPPTTSRTTYSQQPKTPCAQAST